MHACIPCSTNPYNQVIRDLPWIPDLNPDPKLRTALRNQMRIVCLGYVVLDTFNNVSRDEDNILEQIYIKQICPDFYYDDF